jgi:hypothetical protein
LTYPLVVAVVVAVIVMMVIAVAVAHVRNDAAMVLIVARAGRIVVGQGRRGRRGEERRAHGGDQ